MKPDLFFQSYPRTSTKPVKNVWDQMNKAVKCYVFSRRWAPSVLKTFSIGTEQNHTICPVTFVIHIAHANVCFQDEVVLSVLSIIELKYVLSVPFEILVGCDYIIHMCIYL